MNTQTSPIYLNQDVSPSKRISLLQAGVNAINTIVSVILTMVAAVFVMWLNGRQQEFDQLQDK